MVLALYNLEERISSCAWLEVENASSPIAKRKEYLVIYDERMDSHLQLECENV